ncbi:hypothetical protein WUBG_18582 [Wuchereria bancrofti]|uniref:Uncharacterized protein n=1 Tax=Wuchereria bancrofti TaxID=6293 RepID=J9E575_WUCBA|nr:hypothetical protein WUBG_18582 [Wuchereria bancrofti]
MHYVRLATDDIDTVTYAQFNTYPIAIPITTTISTTNITNVTTTTTTTATTTTTTAIAITTTTNEFIGNIIK